MSSNPAPEHDQRLKDAWCNQRSRVDAWEDRPFPPLEWVELEAFLYGTATTLAAVVGPAPNLERELAELIGTYLAGERAAQVDIPSSSPPGRAWSAIPSASLSGPFVDSMRRLHTYGSIGTLLDDDLPGTSEQFVRRIESDLDALASLLSKLPKAAATAGRLNLQMVHDIALARLAIDEGTRQAPAAGLAWLGRVSVKTVQNLLSREQLTGGSGSAAPHSARNWLAQRKDWSRSCWREAIEAINSGLVAPFQEFDAKQDPAASPDSEGDVVDWIFVPRAADGALFLPNLMRPRGWTIGPRGGERSFGDYWRALDHLQKTDRPHWRRPNEAGAYNIVVARDWVRIPRAEIELQLRAVLKTGGCP
ncbi:hypothetical protein ACVWZM_004127 [Bradyrhizobium sp. USDA 4501]